MFITTATTAFAFLSTALADQMPISTFGIWAALLIILNYIYVITNYAAIVVFFEKVRLNKKKNK